MSSMDCNHIFSRKRTSLLYLVFKDPQSSCWNLIHSGGRGPLYDRPSQHFEIERNVHILQYVHISKSPLSASWTITTVWDRMDAFFSYKFSICIVLNCPYSYKYHSVDWTPFMSHSQRRWYFSVVVRSKIVKLIEKAFVLWINPCLEPRPCSSWYTIKTIVWLVALSLACRWL